MITVTAKKTSVGWSVVAQRPGESAILSAHNTREAAEDERDHIARCFRTLGVDIEEN